MKLEDLGLIGNCQFASLIHASGDVVWLCFPRFDSPPVFGQLLDPDGGRFGVCPADGSIGRQQYLDNTNVLETVFSGPDGRFRVIDLAPRFQRHGRMYRPTQLIRIVESLEGSPQIRVNCEPVNGWSKVRQLPTNGSNHLQFQAHGADLRLTTDLPLSYLDGRAFALNGRHYLALTWDSPILESLPAHCEDCLQETTRHWRHWVKHCDIPPDYQHEVIRSALALKLHCFEDTGAIIASVTTSIPEAPGSGRTWDYRYCWLRDAYYVVDAFRLLGHFEEREAFVNYVLNTTSRRPDLSLSPLYDVTGDDSPPERIEPAWAGFEGDGPVRVGNGAADQVQYDVFGELVLALAPIYYDERFRAERSPATLDLLFRLAERAVSVAGMPDRGIWEFRKESTPQTFSNMMCWAAADRAAGIADRHMPARAASLHAAADRIRDAITQRAWSASRSSYAGDYNGDNLDASLLQMAPLRLFPRGDERLRQTIEAIWHGLTHNGWLMRYRTDDGLGETSAAFLLCTFWLIEALVLIDRQDDARALMDSTRRILSPLGLMAEDYDMASKRMSGNFPQAYSHVGLIRAAFAASPRWRDIL